MSKSQPKKIRIQKDPLKEFTRELNAEDKQTHKMHMQEYSTVKAGLKHMQNYQKPRKAPQSDKRKKSAIVHFEPRGPLRTPCTVMAFQRDEPTALEIVKGANARPRTSAVDLGAFRSKKVETGNAWANTVMNGLPEGDSRYPDPFTLVKTTQTVVSTSIRVSSYATSSTSSASTYDWGTAGMLKGSGVATFSEQYGLYGFGCSWSEYSSPTHTCGQVWHNAGMNVNDFYTRPNGVVLDIVPRLVGPAHTIKVYAVPLQPFVKADITTDQPLGWPTSFSEGLSGTMVSWGGREWEQDATSKGIRLITLPLDSRCFDFLGGSAERYSIGTSSGMAWSGWLWWAYGMCEGDSFDVICTCCEECILKTYLESTQYAWPATVRPSNSSARDRSNNVVKSLAEKGMTAFSMIDQVVDFAKEAWGIGKKIASFIGAAAGFLAFAPVMGQRQLKIEEKKEEKEDYDFPDRMDRGIAPTPRLVRPGPLDSRSSSSSSQSLVPSSDGRRQ